MIYFIENLETKHIKIGFTTDIKNRLSNLQTSSPYELKVLAVCEGNDKTEKELHIKFNDYHTRGEWFNPNKELIDYISQFPPYKSDNKQHGNLASLRKQKKMSMEEVGKKMKISKQAVSDIEKRYEYGNITIKNLRSYLDANGYDVTIVFSPK